jgi:hypothetical protein
LQHEPAGTPSWRRVRSTGQAARVHTGQLLVSLPGSRSEIQTNRGVRLTLHGTMPELSPGVPIFESAVVLHSNDALDLDLTLRRGRILLTNTKKDGPARVRVRFENTMNPAAREHWDLILEERGTEVLVDRWGYYGGGETFHANPKHPNRNDPTSQVGLVVLRGRVTVRSDDTTYTMDAPPGAVLLGWNSRSGLGTPRHLDKLPEWAGPRAWAAKELEPIDALRATLATLPAEKACMKALGSEDAAERRLAVHCLAALDMLPQLLGALATKDHADVRQSAIEALRYWVGNSRDNPYRVYDELKKRYSPVEAENLVALLHTFSAEALARPETYTTLIDQLSSTRLPLRELAAWHLYQLVPEARKRIPWSATAAPEALQRTHAAWRELIPPGKLPPQPKAPAGK